jgi:hypothetical protein
MAVSVSLCRSEKYGGVTCCCFSDNELIDKIKLATA